MYLLTASGSSLDNLMSRSSRDNPVCLDKVFSTSGPIACSSCGGAICWLGPDPTHYFRGCTLPALLEAFHELA